MNDAQRFIEDPKRDYLISGFTDMLIEGVNFIHFNDGSTIFDDLITGERGILERGVLWRSESSRYEENHEKSN